MEKRLCIQKFFLNLHRQTIKQINYETSKHNIHDQVH